MGIEISGDNVVCFRCGTRYPRRKTNFSTNYGSTYRGVGSLHVCKNCLDAIYSNYLIECKQSKDAVRQTCRKLDLYWDEELYNAAAIKCAPKAIMQEYVTCLNNKKYAGKSYDDTLIAEGSLWKFIHEDFQEPVNVDNKVLVSDNEQEIDQKELQELVDFWGTGFSTNDYLSLKARYDKWAEGTSANFDTATEILIKQICLTELDIERDRASGRSPEKSIQTLNTLLGSANLKPVQQKQDEENSILENTPLGVWLYRYENERPLPEVDDELKDVNRVRQYVFTWMGHLCKMLGLKNEYVDLYESAMKEFTVQKPTFEEDDDSVSLSDLFENGDS